MAMNHKNIRWISLMAGTLFLASACSDDGSGQSTPPDKGVIGKDSKASGKDGKASGKDGSKPNPDKGAPTPGFTGWRDLSGKVPAPGRHTATRLKDGRVLFAGGMIYDSGPKGSVKAWLYNPTSHTVKSVGDMAQRRASHQAVLLDGGKVLVMGGLEGSSYKPLAEAELFDPKTNKWSKVANMPDKRASHKAVKLNNGKVMVVGGYGTGTTYYDSFNLYDPQTRSWVSPALSMKYRRSAHDATLLPDGRLVISGGWGGTGSDTTKYDNLTSVELFDTVKNTLAESKGKLSAKI